MGRSAEIGGGKMTDRELYQASLNDKAAEIARLRALVEVKDEAFRTLLKCDFCHTCPGCKATIELALDKE